MMNGGLLLSLNSLQSRNFLRNSLLLSNGRD